MTPAAMKTYLRMTPDEQRDLMRVFWRTPCPDPPTIRALEDLGLIRFSGWREDDTHVYSTSAVTYLGYAVGEYILKVTA